LLPSLKKWRPASSHNPGKTAQADTIDPPHMDQTVIEVIGISRIGLEFDSSHRSPGRSGNEAASQGAKCPIILAPDAGARGEDFDIAAVGDGGAPQAFAIHENHNSHKRLATSMFIFN
jgi:hypothetical protein